MSGIPADDRGESGPTTALLVVFGGAAAVGALATLLLGTATLLGVGLVPPTLRGGGTETLLSLGVGWIINGEWNDRAREDG